MFMVKNQLIPKNCDEWCVNASIINRAYYSSYQYCELWLDYVNQFKVKHAWEFENDDERISEHKQIREALKDHGEKNMKTELFNLFKLRIKADYNPFMDITSEEVNNAIHHMEKIFNHLKFD